MKKVLISLIIAAIGAPLFGHCDSPRGPVIATAQQALEKGSVTPVLKWVQPADEAEIRDAFARTMKVRAQSPEAKQLADRWFFETLVRVHRQGEGEPFTGLKAEDYEPEPGIELADNAIDSGSLEATEKAVIGDISSGLRSRFAKVKETKQHANESVEAGRRYVEAYVNFIHYVERLHQTATSSAAHQEAQH